MEWYFIVAIVAVIIGVYVLADHYYTVKEVELIGIEQGEITVQFHMYDGTTIYKNYIGDIEMVYERFFGWAAIGSTAREQMEEELEENEVIWINEKSAIFPSAIRQISITKEKENIEEIRKITYKHLFYTSEQYEDYVEV